MITANEITTFLLGSNEGEMGKLENTAMNLSSLCFRVFFARVNTATGTLSNHTSMVTCLARIRMKFDYCFVLVRPD